MVSGQLIALEGPKLAGKTTLITALSTRLAAAPMADVVLTKEPTPAFDLTREQCMRGVELAASIAEDRRQHVKDMIGPALVDGRTVICDRYILSSYVFHTADGVPETVIEELNSDFPRPALNLVLRVSAGELRRRHIQRATTTRLQSDDAGTEAAAYMRYAEYMKRQGVPSRVVDNSTMTDHQTLLDWLCALCVGGAR
ncbi:AAA family ATPase [Actinomadura sp. NPDC048394]|uniref:dTMP kinase n=1 Tax=Actinomadura sp. NPDC048394 TaxID=3158223 RepID=UPI0033D22A1D